MDFLNIQDGRLKVFLSFNVSETRLSRYQRQLVCTWLNFSDEATFERNTRIVACESSKAKQ